MMTYSDFIDLIKTDSRFDNFSAMFSHEPLLRFVYAEKCILGPLSEKRVFFNATFNEEGGIAHSTDVILDECYGVFTPFLLKGVWIPLALGAHYSILPNLDEMPIARNRNGQKEILFFIHPKSEEVFSQLLETYQEHCITVSALSLSSPRSLLIALPNERGEYEPIMVKVSLNQLAHGVLRLLSERECALSVANTSIFSRILARNETIPLKLFEDPFSFVPKHPERYTCGMSYRLLPDYLNPKFSATTEWHFVIPLLAFYGQKNAHFFKEVVQKNGGNVTDFLSSFFQLYIQALFPLLLEHELSMEAHGQNLLLVFNEQFQLQHVMYRDMGGVNTPIQENDYDLPTNLRTPKLSYFHNHTIDAANAIEHLVVWRGLFPLTKQLVKNAEYFCLTDPAFHQWYEMCLKMQPSTGVLGNWTDGDSTSDVHQEQLDVIAFYRYGYVETLFGQTIIAYLLEHNLVDQGAIDQLNSHLYLPEQLSEDLWVAPCTYYTFFDEMIKMVLNKHELQLTNRSFNK